MEINKANFNQVQGDEFDQIGKIFAVDLYTFLIVWKLFYVFFLIPIIIKCKGQRAW